MQLWPEEGHKNIHTLHAVAWCLKEALPYKSIIVYYQREYNAVSSSAGRENLTNVLSVLINLGLSQRASLNCPGPNVISSST